MMTSVIMLVLPLVVAASIAAANSEVVNSATERAEAWLRALRTDLSHRSGWFAALVVRPVIGLVLKLSDWTDGFQNRGLKNGVRVGAALYLVAVWGLLLVFALQIALTLAFIAAAIYIGLKVLVSASPEVRQGYEVSKRVLGTAGPGQRINPETGVIQEEGLLGWRDTDRRVDPETGNLQKEGLIGWGDSDQRIDQESGVLQEEGLIGYRDTDVRIDPETGIIQKQGLLGWQDTDVRIDPETGRRQKQGLLGWTDE